MIDQAHARPPPLAGAEIGLDHLGIALDLLGRAGGDAPAAVEHDDPVGDVHDHAHVVLDQHDGDAALLVHVEDVARHVFLLFLVHAAHRLVEQQQLGLERQRAAQFDPLAQAVGQRRRRLLAQVLQLQELDDLLDRLAVGDVSSFCAMPQ